MSSTKTTPAKPVVLPFFIVNLQNHLERTFDLWQIKTPSANIKFLRSLIFFSALLATIYWPVQDLFPEALILILTWILLSLRDKPVYRWLLMLNIMLNIAWLYYFMRIFIPMY